MPGHLSEFSQLSFEPEILIIIVYTVISSCRFPVLFTIRTYAEVSVIIITMSWLISTWFPRAEIIVIIVVTSWPISTWSPTIFILVCWSIDARISWSLLIKIRVSLPSILASTKVSIVHITMPWSVTLTFPMKSVIYVFDLWQFCGFLQERRVRLDARTLKFFFKLSLDVEHHTLVENRI